MIMGGVIQVNHPYKGHVGEVSKTLKIGKDYGK